MISPAWTLPQVLNKFPGTRAVLDKYGLHGCGGERGPDESLEVFARVHAIELPRLIADLEEAASRPADPGAPFRETLADFLYKRHFRGAIAVLLTAGATLGAVLLYLNAGRRSLTSLELLPYIQAHANAQIFGWVGLFVMGFAVQGLPRFKYVRLWRPEWANAAFLLMLAGLALRTSSPLLPAGALPAALLGGGLQFAAVTVFLLVLGKTLAASTLREPWDRYVTASAFFFFIGAMLEPVLPWEMSTAATEGDLIRRIASFSGPVRDIQVLGFAGFIVLGVTQRILPTAFGFRDPGRRVSGIAFALMIGGLVVDVGAWITFRTTRAPLWAMISWGGVAAYAVGAIALAVSMRGLTGGAPDRSTKFIRAAFLWLLFASALTLFLPLYTKLAGLRFSHGYNGATRHAFTVGFVSLMIVGVSSRIVPMLAGVDPRRLPALWAPFVLIVAGNGLRVMSQILTDFAPSTAYPVMGVSGVLQVAGFLVWGIHIWKLLGSRPEPSISEARPARIEAHMSPAQVIEWFPQTMDVFTAHGFGLLQNPLLRRTMGRSVTLAGACSMKSADLGSLLTELNRRIHPSAGE
jgi:hypothetical protein